MRYYNIGYVKKYVSANMASLNPIMKEKAAKCRFEIISENILYSGDLERNSDAGLYSTARQLVFIRILFWFLKDMLDYKT